MANVENFERRRIWFKERFGYDRNVVLAREINSRRIIRATVLTALGGAWESIGPSNCSGRVSGIALDARDPSILYAACSGGGVWTTKDDGANWSTGMGAEASIAIGAIAVSQFTGEVFAATGEWTGGIGWGVDPMLSGQGIYVSSDQGSSWRGLGPIRSDQCSAIQVIDAKTLLVSGNQGLELSADAGASWTQIAGLPPTDISDVQVDNQDTSFVVASVDRQFVMYSVDTCVTWRIVGAGLPTGWRLDSPKITISRREGRRRVLVKAGDTLFESDDDCATFTPIHEFSDNIFFYSWCNVVSSDPVSPDRLLAGSNNLYFSDDGGKSWRQTAGYNTAVHPDQQAIVWSPLLPNKCYLANDGGVYLSTTGGQTWSNIGRGIIGGHFYCMGASNSSPAKIAGAVQDDGGYRGTIGSPVWRETPLGEGGYFEFDPADDRIIYHDTWFVNLHRSDDGGANWQDLGIDTDSNYLESLAIDDSDPRCIAAITKLNSVMLSIDRGDTWIEVLRPPTPLRALKFGLDGRVSFLFAAGHGGNAWVSSDRGQHWKTLDLSSIGDILHVETIADDGRKLLISTRGGGSFGLNIVEFDANWANSVVRDAMGDLPVVAQSLMPSSILAHHATGRIFLLNLAGLFMSADAGEHWTDWAVGLPNVFLSDIDAPRGSNWLYASTLGRGVFRRSLTN